MSPRVGRPPKQKTPTEAADSVMIALAQTASGLGKDYLGSSVDALTENEAIHILTSMVRSGEAGPSAPQFVKAILEIRAQSGAAIGPPPPTTPEVTYDRLRRLFGFVNQPILDRAYADHAADRSKATILPPEPRPDGLSEPETAPEAVLEAEMDPETDVSGGGDLE